MPSNPVALFRSFFTSSIRRETAETRIVFLGLMALADGKGFVQATIDAIADYVNIDHQVVMTAMTRLQDVDPDSTSPAEEGRRVLMIGPNRWQLINYEHYAKIFAEIIAEMKEASAEAERLERRREQLREAQQRQREKRKTRTEPASSAGSPQAHLADHPRHQESDDVDDAAKAGDLQRTITRVDVSRKAEPEKDDARGREFGSESIEMRLAQYLFRHIRKNNPQAKEPNYQVWAREFDLLLRVDHREVEEVKRLIGYAQKDAFWMRNILSPRKLREKYDRLILDEKGGKDGSGKQRGDGKRFDDYR